MHRESRGGRQLTRTEDQAIWAARDAEGRMRWIALFNLAEEEHTIHCPVEKLRDRQAAADSNILLRELWTGEETMLPEAEPAYSVPAHGVRLIEVR